MNLTNKEPIAIIGIGCRFPGDADTVSAFWEMLINGRDGIVEVPRNRWDVRRFYDLDRDMPGKTYVKHGGFLRNPIDEMDALFFGISPREAATLDPQQRILLEVAWEAFENAGLVPEQLAGTDIGVFIGGFMMDHLAGQTNILNRDQLNTHSAASFGHTMLSARIAYLFDLTGPCITVDTACSSSLVALHQACQAIWNGECNLALVGGVNIMARVETMVAMCKSQFLSPDGRSKSFDARADGYGRGEGAGVVVLKPLSAAERDGDLIYATVRATGVNQDGRTDGITVPNEFAQSALIRMVYAQAGVDPGQVGYIEAHGTGTAVGDPVECRALGSALSENRDSANPCWIGSVKANIGHLEAAAGVAGVIKAALVLHYGQIPPIANLQTPNPNIPFGDLKLRLPRKVETLPCDHGPALVGVNSFGYGGTNAHALLQAAQGVERVKSPENKLTGPWFLPLSARSEKALVALASAYRDILVRQEESTIRDVCYSAATRRQHHNHRLALVGENGNDLVNQLEAFATGQGAHLLSGKVLLGQVEKPVFVFTGMGPQWWGMGRQLLKTESVFRETVEKCDAVFHRLAGWSILEEMMMDEERSRMVEPQISQPANFVLQVGLSALWEANGIVPAAIVGHSVGEVSAAYISGMLSLEDAVAVSYHRSRLQKKVSGQGKMLAVGLPVAQCEAIVERYGADRISIAAINSPSAITLSGSSETLQQIAAELESQEVFHRFLRVELAYHSPVMGVLRAELLDSLCGLKPQSPIVPLYSTVTGKRVDTACYDAAYWYDNIRQPVYFAKAIESLVGDGHSIFLEIGPHPVLGGSIKEVVSALNTRGKVVASLKRMEPEQITMLRALGELYTAGSAPNWSRFYEHGGHYVHLPRYPWQREIYWSETQAAIFDRIGTNIDHPLLGHRQDEPEPVWEQPVNSQFLPWLHQHKIQDLVILPGAAYVEIGLALFGLINKGSATGTLEELIFQRALVINEHIEPLLRTTYDPQHRRYAIHSRINGLWTMHSGGRFSFVPPPTIPDQDLSDIQRRCTDKPDVTALYARLAGRGMQYGPAFQGIQEIWRGEDEILVLVTTPGAIGEVRPETRHGDIAEDAYHVHPILLDSVFQSLISMLSEDDDKSFVPVEVGRLSFYDRPKSQLWAHIRLIKRNTNAIEVNLLLCDKIGKVLLDIRDLRCQSLSAGGSSVSKRDLDEWFYQVEWESLPLLTKPKLTGRWLLFMDSSGVAEKLTEHMRAANISDITRVYAGDKFERRPNGDYVIRRLSKTDMARLVETARVEECRGVAFCWALDIDEQHDADGARAAADWLNCLQTVSAAWSESNLLRLFLVTRGGQSAAGEAITPQQATSIGLARVATSEYMTRCTSVDLPAQVDENSLALITAELLGNDEEREIALRGGQRLAYRLVRTSPKEIIGAIVVEPSCINGRDAFALMRDGETPQWHTVKRQLPDSSQTELFVKHAVLPPGGLNASGETLIAISGVRVDSAANIGRSLLPNVVGIVPVHELRNYVNLPTTSLIIEAVSEGRASLTALSKRLIGIADGMPKSARLAASLLPFSRALYALEQCARLKKGERVFICAAADGTDLAVAQVAVRMGAEVFVTCRDASKRDALQALGITHVLPGDSLEFVDEVLCRTSAQGVDVVVNTASGEFAEKSLLLLAPYGRFVNFNNTTSEWNLDNTKQKNTSFYMVDMEHVVASRPDLMRDLMSKIIASFSTNELTPLAVPYFPADKLAEALKANVEQAVVLEMGAAEVLMALPSCVDRDLFRNDATYLVTGGFGGFGLALARWMVARGAKNLLLVGRRGAATPEAQRAIIDLEQSGAQVAAVAADVSNEKDVIRVMDQIMRNLPPLAGVFHTAGVLDDAMLSDLTPSRLNTVMEPKALGAWYLHKHTSHQSLDYFVMFSSISALVGKPGQGNYVAANAFLDQLAHCRRAHRLPGLSLNWGVLSEVGMAARQNVGERLERLGIGSFTPEEAMTMLDTALRGQHAQLGLMNIDWQVWGGNIQDASTKLRYGRLIGAENLGKENPSVTFRKEIADLSPALRHRQVAPALLKLVARIMRLPTDALDGVTPLNSLGLDSLMAAELQSAIMIQTGVNLSVLDLMQGNTVEQLADKVLARMGIVNLR